MADFNVRSDAVNVEQIMEQIRARIREKRGVDYTEAQIHELASVKLEKFLDPRGVRSDLLEQFRRAQPPYAPPELPNFAFEDETLFTSTRAPLRIIRRLLMPILKLFFNPNPLIQALNIQSKLNASLAEREAKRDAARYAFDQLHYEVMHNLVIETTRLGIEVKNLKMRLESLASRLEFNERRARALESAVVYKAGPEERGRHDDSRREEPRRDESRREDSRRDESRRDESRREDARRDESRRQDQRRPEPPPRQQPAPAQPEVAETAAVVADAATAEGQGQAAAAEGPGTRSRRRRRRRGRRGSGAAAALMAGGQAATEAESALDAEGQFTADENEPDTEQETDVESTAIPNQEAAPSEPSQSDVRMARPEPFEHAFGAQAHPAEAAASDPAMAPTPAPTPAPAAEQPATNAQEPTTADPSVAPEQ